MDVKKKRKGKESKVDALGRRFLLTELTPELNLLELQVEQM